MSSRQPVETADLDIYGAGEMPWSRAEEALHKGSVDPATPWFLGTVRPDGRPHSAGIGVALLDGELYFTSGAGARKARNLAANPACTLSVRGDGIDLALEGAAERVTDPPCSRPSRPSTATAAGPRRWRATR